ncbi:MAG: DUF1565 domain-containing protein [Calditrichaeota bacterium]|nr:MAG: DUF1565 domain-containing protein [Calditrichota bacterium]
MNDNHLRFAFVFLLLYTFSAVLQAKTLYVDSGLGHDRNPGTAQAPFKTLKRAVKKMKGGDTLKIYGGIYRETLRSVPGGSRMRPTVIEAVDKQMVMIRHKGKVLRLDAPYITVRGVHLDGAYGEAAICDINASHITIQGCTIQNSRRDLVTIASVEDIRIVQCFIHHGLSWYPQTRREPHGISTDGVKGLIIRGCTISQITGDCIQIAPSRKDWNDVLIEDCTFYVSPLTAVEVKEAGLPEEAVGYLLAENALDLKARKTDHASRHTITVRNVTAYGFLSDRIKNAAAFNIKNPVTAILDRITVHDSEIAFRVRRPAHATISNSVIYKVEVGLRYEDALPELRVLNNTFGTDIRKNLQAAGSQPLDMVFINNLFIGKKLPRPLRGHVRNRAIAPGLASHYFHDPARHDYHLRADCLAIDSGLPLDDAALNHDRDGRMRPLGEQWDMGAYEFNPNRAAP